SAPYTPGEAVYIAQGQMAARQVRHGLRRHAKIAAVKAQTGQELVGPDGGDRALARVAHGDGAAEGEKADLCHRDSLPATPSGAAKMAERSAAGNSQDMRSGCPP